jgi:uncharacterized protein involved in exopolysaccharide biosynthesis
VDLCPDRKLSALLHERLKLQQAYAHVLRRVGASHPQRTHTNAKRATHRKALRKAIRLNAEQIAARCLELYTP